MKSLNINKNKKEGKNGHCGSLGTGNRCGAEVLASLPHGRDGKPVQSAWRLSRLRPGFRGQEQGAEGFSDSFSAFAEQAPWGLVTAAETISSGLSLFFPSNFIQNIKGCSTSTTPLVSPISFFSSHALAVPHGAGWLVERRCPSPGIGG